MLQLFANICFFETEDGVVVFDTGLEFNGPRVVDEIRAVTDQPVRYIIYGHGHADHAFGAWSILADAEERGHPRPVIIAHENLPARFDRYREMLPYQEHINRVQFSIPDGLPAFVRNFIYPDETYRDSLSIRLGSQTFILEHAMGETDDATWMYVPELKAACASDLWVWSCPNLGNPFKVQRYELEWARALQRIASKPVELLLPGHGPALTGEQDIREACLTVSSALLFIRGQVVSMLNEGRWQEDILNDFEWPSRFADSPYLAPIYGHPHFIVQAVLRRYHGWYDGNPTHLFPSAACEVAAEVLGLVKDKEAILSRARELTQEGRRQLALHLLDFIIDGGGIESRDALCLKAELLRDIASVERSLIARNILLAGAEQIERAAALADEGD